MSKLFARAREVRMRQLEAKGKLNPEFVQQQIDDAANKELEKVGLNLDNASPSDIKQFNAASVRKIRSEMSGNGLLKAGLTFGGSVTERATLGYYSALVEQNWILIRQNELIIRHLEESKEK